MEQELNKFYGLDKGERIFVLTDGLWGRKTKKSLEVKEIIDKDNLMANISQHPILALDTLPLLRQRFYSKVEQPWELPIANACFFSYLRKLLLHRYTLQQLIDLRLL